MQLEDVVQRLRADLLAGRYGAQVKLSEIPLALSVGVSRTLIRLALSELEREGLVQRAPRRGYRARSFTLDEVANAIEVRGTLEGMAARLCAERGVASSDLAELKAILDRMDPLLDRIVHDPEARQVWVDLNAGFHARIVGLSGNGALEATVTQLSRMPLVAARAIVFSVGNPDVLVRRLGRAHAEHHDVFEAIRRREGKRAETIMFEHARRSAENKRQGFDLASIHQSDGAVPGLALVKTS